VLLVHETAVAPKPPAETLVPSALPSFARYGLEPILRRPEFAGSARHGSIWGSSELRWREVDGPERGYRVERRAFDLALRAHAAERGVEVLEGWRVLDPLDGTEPWTLQGPDGHRERVEARTRVVACGGARGAPTPGVRRGAVETCALWALVESGREFLDATLVEAVREGWLWWLPLADGRVCLTLFADLEEVKGVGRDEQYRAALRGALGPARDVHTGRVRGLVCTPSLGRASGDLLLAGDAAACIDPLSSQGIEKALASGMECAFGVNTWLDAPEMGATIQAHRVRWETRLFRAHARDALAYYQREQRFADAPFWQRRQRVARVDSAPGPPALPSRLQRGPGLREVTTLQRHERHFVPRPAYSTADADEALQRIGPVELAPLIELLPCATEELFERARRHPRLAGLDPGTLRQALVELLRLGFLRAPVATPDRATGSR